MRRPRFRQSPPRRICRTALGSRRRYGYIYQKREGGSAARWMSSMKSAATSHRSCALRHVRNRSSHSPVRQLSLMRRAREVTSGSRPLLPRPALTCRCGVSGLWARAEGLYGVPDLTEAICRNHTFPPGYLASLDDTISNHDVALGLDLPASAGPRGSSSRRPVWVVVRPIFQSRRRRTGSRPRSRGGRIARRGSGRRLAGPAGNRGVRGRSWRRLPIRTGPRRGVGAG